MKFWITFGLIIIAAFYAIWYLETHRSTPEAFGKMDRKIAAFYEAHGPVVDTILIAVVILIACWIVYGAPR